MGNSFRYFWLQLNKHVKNGTDLDWKNFPKQLYYYEEFVSYKLREEAEESSITNTKNFMKNDMSHNT